MEQTAEVSGTLPPWMQLEIFFRQNFHYLIIAAVVMFIAYRKLSHEISEYFAKRKVQAGRESAQLQSMAERMNVARQKQLEAAQRSRVADAEMRMRRAANQRDEKAAQLPGPEPAISETKTKTFEREEKEDEKEEKDNPKRLPKLPGGERSTYQPFTSCDDKGSRFKNVRRDCGPKGG